MKIAFTLLLLSSLSVLAETSERRSESFFNDELLIVNQKAPKLSELPCFPRINFKKLVHVREDFLSEMHNTFRPETDPTPRFLDIRYPQK